MIGRAARNTSAAHLFPISSISSQRHMIRSQPTEPRKGSAVFDQQPETHTFLRFLHTSDCSPFRPATAAGAMVSQGFFPRSECRRCDGNSRTEELELVDAVFATHCDRPSCIESLRGEAGAPGKSSCSMGSRSTSAKSVCSGKEGDVAAADQNMHSLTAEILIARVER